MYMSKNSKLAQVSPRGVAFSNFFSVPEQQLKIGASIATWCCLSLLYMSSNSKLLLVLLQCLEHNICIISGKVTQNWYSILPYRIILFGNWTVGGQHLKVGASIAMKP